MGIITKEKAEKIINRINCYTRHTFLTKYKFLRNTDLSDLLNFFVNNCGLNVLEKPPIDGKKYIIENGDWVDVPKIGTVEEAPIDGKKYIRQDGSWIEIKEGVDGYGIYADVGQPTDAMNIPKGSLYIDTTNGTLYRNSLMTREEADASGILNFQVDGSPNIWELKGNIKGATGYVDVEVARYKPATPYSIINQPLVTGLDLTKGDKLHMIFADDANSMPWQIATIKLPLLTVNTFYIWNYDTAYLTGVINNQTTGSITFDDVNRATELQEIWITKRTLL